MALSAPFCPLAFLLSPDQSGRWLVGAVGIEPTSEIWVGESSIGRNPRTYGDSVTAEVASSSLVVPAILSKPLRRFSLKPSRARKGHVSRPFCVLCSDPQSFI